MLIPCSYFFCKDTQIISLKATFHGFLFEVCRTGSKMKEIIPNEKKNFRDYVLDFQPVLVVTFPNSRTFSSRMSRKKGTERFKKSSLILHLEGTLRQKRHIVDREKAYRW